MKLLAKIYEKEIKAKSNGKSFKVLKLLTMNSKKDSVIFGDVKIYLKKEHIMSLLNNNPTKVFEIELSKITYEEKYNKKTFHIRDMKIITENDAFIFNGEIQELLDKYNQESIDKYLEG